MEQVLRHAAAVWDFNPDNITLLQKRGIDAKLLPLGYHEKLATIPDRPAHEDIDVLFYGLINPHRHQILEPLAKQCTLRTSAASTARNATPGSPAPKSSSTSTIPIPIAEQVRVSYLLNNARCIFLFPEQSPWDPFAPCGPTAPYDKLIDTCLNLLADPPARACLKQSARSEFPKKPMTDNLQSLV